MGRGNFAAWPPILRARIRDIKQIMGVGPKWRRGIGASGMLATVVAITIWSSRNGANRHMVLRADSRNVTARIAKTKTTDGSLNSILRRLTYHFLDAGVEVSPCYIRGAHNMSAGGLERWADEAAVVLQRIVRMGQGELPIERLRSILQPNGSPGDVGACTLMWGYMNSTEKGTI